MNLNSCISALGFLIIIFATLSANAVVTIQRMYYPNGTVLVEAVFENGIPNGMAVLYSETGYKMETGYFKNGLREGVFSYYDKNGFLFMQRHFSKGLLHGSLKIFNPNGKVLIATWFKNGVQSRDLRVYFPSGKVNERYSPPDATGISKRTIYDKSGHIRNVEYVPMPMPEVFMTTRPGLVNQLWQQVAQNSGMSAYNDGKTGSGVVLNSDISQRTAPSAGVQSTAMPQNATMPQNVVVLNPLPMNGNGNALPTIQAPVYVQMLPVQ